MFDLICAHVLPMEMKVAGTPSYIQGDDVSNFKHMKLWIAAARHNFTQLQW